MGTIASLFPWAKERLGDGPVSVHGYFKKKRIYTETIDLIDA